MKNIKRIQNTLWAARNKMGYSQKEVARILGLRRTSVLSRYEHGTRMPGLINALKLEIVYRTPVAFLFADLYLEIKEEIRKREEKMRP